MTKTEIALTLAKQYANIEVDMFEACDYRQEAKQAHAVKPDEHTRNNLAWSKNEVKMLRANMATVETTRDLLGITAKTWSKAIYGAYLYNSQQKELTEK